MNKSSDSPPADYRSWIRKINGKAQVIRRISLDRPFCVSELAAYNRLVRRETILQQCIEQPGYKIAPSEVSQSSQHEVDTPRPVQAPVSSHPLLYIHWHQKQQKLSPFTIPVYPTPSHLSDIIIDDNSCVLYLLTHIFAFIDVFRYSLLSGSLTSMRR